MDTKKFLISGFFAGLVIFFISLIFGFLVPIFLPYNVLELGGMRAATDPVMLLFFLHYWVYGFAMAFVYPHFSNAITKGTYIDKGKLFGFLMWLVATLPSAFVVYTSMDYPIGFTFSQLVGGLIYMLLAGIVIAKFME